MTMTKPKDDASEPQATKVTISPKEDVMLLHSPTEDGKGMRVIRSRQGKVEAGELRQTEEGKPLQGEMVSLQPRKESPFVCDVTDSYAPEERASSVGPAKVTTRAYRQNWDSIFGEAPESDEDDADKVWNLGRKSYSSY